MSERYDNVLKHICDLFEDIKKQLFTDSWLQEETRFLLCLFDKNRETRGLLVYKIDEKENIFCPEKDMTEDDYLQEIDQFIYENYQAEKTLKQQFEIKESGIYGCYVCISPCIVKNIGKFLLVKTFEEFAKETVQWFLKVLSDGDGVPRRLGELQTDQNIAWKIRERAAASVCEYMEMAFFPINISLINSLSGEYYEKEENRATLAFLPESLNGAIESSDLIFDLRQSNAKGEIEFISENIRWIRKLSQMSDDRLSLLFFVPPGAKRYQVLGISEEKNIENMVGGGENLVFLKAKIGKHMQWDLFLNNSYMFSYINGQAKIRYQMSEEYLKRRCISVFGKDNDYSNAIQSVLKSHEQHHGTMLIIMNGEDAKNEAKRLCDRNYGMRGEKKGIPTLIIVVSEDRTVDIFSTKETIQKDSV